MRRNLIAIDCLGLEQKIGKIAALDSRTRSLKRRRKYKNDSFLKN